MKKNLEKLKNIFKSKKSDSNNENVSSKKSFLKNKILYLVLIVIVIIAIPIAVITNNKHEEKLKKLYLEYPQLDPEYKGSYDKSSGKVKEVPLLEHKSEKIDNCIFSDVMFSYSPSNSSFSGKFTSLDDDITGTVYIEFVLYDKNKNVVKKFHNRLLNVKKGEPQIVLAEYHQEINNVDSVDIKVRR